MNKTLAHGLLIGSTLLSAAALAAGDRVIDVQQLQNTLAKTHAQWQAGNTPQSRLSRAELTRMMGLQEAPKGTLDFRGLNTRLSGLASTIDWRNKDGINWLSPVMNQGNCGSCVAFAAIATLEAQTSITSQTPWLRPTYSPQELFACGGGGCDTGWMPGSAASFLKGKGVPDEACMPYTSGSTGQDVACSAKCVDATNRSVKISGFSTPSSYWSGSAEAVKAALKSGPLMTTLNVHADFVTYTGGIYKTTTSDVVGGHAVSLIGYDDSKGAWLIRNSWGPEWGESGFAWVSYDDPSGIASETWALQLPTPSGALAVTSPADREIASGQYTLAAQANGLKLTGTSFHIKGANGKEVATVSCSSRGTEGCATLFDTTTLADGRYEIYADAGSAKSLRREFFVLNSEPKFSLSFKPKAGVDLSKPQSGRPEFDITATFGAVPIQHVEFRAIDSTGKVVSTKSNDYVLPQMTMGWRTMTVTDGEYTILFHGESTYQGKVYSADSNAFHIVVKN